VLFKSFFYQKGSGLEFPLNWTAFWCFPDSMWILIDPRPLYATEKLFSHISQNTSHSELGSFNFRNGNSFANCLLKRQMYFLSNTFLPDFLCFYQKNEKYYQKSFQCYIWWQLEKMGQNLDIFKVWPPDFAQKNIYFILILSKSTYELILPKKIFFVEISIFEKNVFCVRNCSWNISKDI
jgi:hypothetical protein